MSIISVLSAIKNAPCYYLAKRSFDNPQTSKGTGFSCGIRAKCSVFAEAKGNITIGDNVSIHGSLIIAGDGCISIGSNTTVRHDTEIYATDCITIGKCVIISNNVVIYDNNSHPTNPEARYIMSLKGPNDESWSGVYAEHKPVVIEDNVWIGQRSTILKGVTIGKGSIVATNSVVTHDVPPMSIVAGNPAKVVKRL